jgi:hypothetical protein
MPDVREAWAVSRVRISDRLSGLYEGNKIELSTVRLPVETATRLTPVARFGPPLKDNGELFRNEIVQFAEA